MLIPIKNSDILNLSSEGRIFYVNNGLPVGAGNLTVPLMTTEQSPFLLGDDMKKEIWKAIPGYEGFYEVSNMGRVKSLIRFVNSRNGKRIVKEKILNPAILRIYPYVSLAKHGNKKGFKVHRLVLEAFIGKCPKDMVCCHGSKGSLVNTLDNIEWGTSKKNNGKDKIRDGKAMYGNRNHASVFTKEIVIEIKNWLKSGMRPCEVIRKLEKTMKISMSAGQGEKVYCISRGDSWSWLKV